jgi:hypothetical protein
MRISEREFLESECNELRYMLSMLTEEDWAEHPIGHSSLQHRLEEVERELQALEPGSEPFCLDLTFRGAPVEGSRSIAAGFAGKAAELFSKAGLALYAGSVNPELKTMGPVPNKAELAPRIVGTVRGSFGFEFEFPRVEESGQLGLFDSGEAPDPTAALVALVDAASRGQEEEVAEALSWVHERAAQELSVFAAYVAKQEATFGVSTAARRVEVPTVDAARRMGELLGRETREGEETLEGVLIGVLPSSRKFELKPREGGQVIGGRLDPALGSGQEIARKWLGHAVRLRTRVIEVRAAKRYVALGFEELDGAP